MQQKYCISSNKCRHQISVTLINLWSHLVMATVHVVTKYQNRPSVSRVQARQKMHKMT